MADAFTPELGVEIAARIAEGSSLRQIAKLDGFPSLRTMMNWSRDHIEFARMLHLARIDRAAALMEESIEIADEPAADVAAVGRNRERTRARQVMAARLDPARWSEKIGVAVGVGNLPGQPPADVDPIEGARRIAFVLARAGQLVEEGRAPPKAEVLRLAHDPGVRAAAAACPEGLRGGSAPSATRPVLRPIRSSDSDAPTVDLYGDVIWHRPMPPAEPTPELPEDDGPVNREEQGWRAPKLPNSYKRQ